MGQPETIGRYQIKSKLKRGGMAVVYRAYDPRFERDVAIKILPMEEHDDANFQARFQREAKTIANLEHPAVVPVHDYGEDQNRLYLVMRLMTGGSLADHLTKGPLSVPEATQIVKRIARALDAAHARGIVHRDLKPGNIMFDQYGDAYLSDFGIARLSDATATLTGAKGAIGTPGYMSPEQIEGHEIDSKSDIYALGVLVFEMLTGRQPFKADTPIMIMVKQLTEPIPDIQEVKPDLPPSYGRVVSQTLAKDRDDRPATAGEVARLLEEAAGINLGAFDSSSITSTTLGAVADLSSVDIASQEIRQPGSEEMTMLDVPAGYDEPSKPPSKPRWGWIMGVLLVGLLVTAVYFTIQSQGDDDEGDAVAAVIDTQDEPELESDEETVQSEAGFEEDEPDDESENENTPDENIDAAALLEQAHTSLSDGNYEDVFATTESILEQEPENVEALFLHGLANRIAENAEDAIADFSRVLELEPGYLDAYREMALTYYWTENYPAAIENSNKCLELDPNHNECFLVQGDAYNRSGENAHAVDSYQQALEINPEQWWVRRELAWVYAVGLGDYEAARDEIQAVVENNPGHTADFYQYGYILANLGEDDDASENYRRYLDSVPKENCPECHDEAQSFLGGYDPLINLVLGKPVTVSSNTSDSEPGQAVDGDIYSAWSPEGNVGEDGHWVEIELGTATQIHRIELYPHQDEAGYSEVRVIARFGDGEWRVILEFNEDTSESYSLEESLDEPIENVTALHIEVLDNSDVWGWHDIRVYGREVE